MAFYISGPKLLFETTEISTHPNSTQQESNYIYLYTTKFGTSIKIRLNRIRDNESQLYCHMTLSAMNYLLYITLYVFIFPIWSLFSYMDRPGTCIIILDQKYNIANSSCHFGSYGSIWTGPSPITYYMGLVHILPYDPQCHELFAIYRCRNKLTYNKAANLQKSIHLFLPTN